MLCPVCSQDVPLEEATVHVNHCLDAVEAEDTPGADCQVTPLDEAALESVTSELPSDLAEDDWVVLDDADLFKGTKPPPRLRSPFGIRDKIRKTLEKSFLVQDQDGFVHIDSPTESVLGSIWRGNPAVDMTQMSETFTEDLASVQEHMNDWKRFKLPDQRSEVVSRFKYLIRKGIPHPMRCSVWKVMGFVNVSKKSDSEMMPDLYNQIFHGSIPEDILNVPTFSGQLRLDSHCLTPTGKGIAKRVLCALATKFVELDYCPILCDIVPILVQFLPEEDALHLAAWMIRASYKWDFLFGCSLKESASHNLVFEKLVENKLPQLYETLKGWQVSLVDVADAWFSRCFVDCLPYNEVLKIFDVYLSEGHEVFYRVGLAILQRASPILTTSTSKEEAEERLKMVGSYFTDHKQLIKQAFRYFFTQRRLGNIRTSNKEALSEVQEPAFQVYYRPKFQSSTIITTLEFETLYSWLPERYQIKDPFRLYLSSEDGFNLLTMVHLSCSHQPTILLVESIGGAVFGAFVTEEWRQTPHVFGDLEMFLFTMRPQTAHYPARPQVNRQFIRVTKETVQIGQGSFGVGLYLDNELNHGSTSSSATYGNQPLDGSKQTTSDFQVKQVELWGFL